MKELPYHKQLEQIISQIDEEMRQSPESGNFKKPRLLLHACCGPCSSYVIEYISKFFDITIYYYNPNIHPEKEYYRRLEELQKFIELFPEATKNNVKLVVDEYNPDDYFTATNVLNETELQKEPEKGERCRRCYEFRMKRAFEYSVKNSFDWFTTTLSISPHKDSEKINTIGKLLQESQFLRIGNTDSESPTKFLPADFKKKGGFLRSTQLSKEYGLWRQDYCGCIYSRQNLKNESN